MTGRKGAAVTVGLVTLFAVLAIAFFSVPRLLDESEGSSSGPVIAIARPWNGYPYAAYTDVELSVRDGCMLLDGDVVFWPFGTTWDAETSTVVFDDGTRIGLGETASFGGGYYQTDLDYTDWLGERVGARIESCIAKTGAANVVVAYPSS